MEVATRREVSRIGHQDAVQDVAVAPTGRYVATGSADGSRELILQHRDRLHRRKCRLQLGPHVLREDLEHLIAHVLDHPPSHLREDAGDVDARDGGDLGLARRFLQHAAGQAQIGAALAAHVHSLCDDLGPARSRVELFEDDLALVARLHRSDLDGHGPRPGLLVELAGDGRAGQALRHPLRIGEKFPHRRRRRLDAERLGDLESHGLMPRGTSRGTVGCRSSTCVLPDRR